VNLIKKEEEKNEKNYSKDCEKGQRTRRKREKNINIPKIIIGEFEFSIFPALGCLHTRRPAVRMDCNQSKT
jgi:hypothetical protein